MDPQHENEPVPLDYSPPPPPDVPRYRTVLSRILVGAGVAIAIVGLFAQSESARVNICVAAFGLVMYGLVIRSPPTRR